MLIQHYNNFSVQDSFLVQQASNSLQRTQLVVIKYRLNLFGISTLAVEMHWLLKRMITAVAG